MTTSFHITTCSVRPVSGGGDVQSLRDGHGLIGETLAELVQQARSVAAGTL
jgi:hypothetical protein